MDPRVLQILPLEVLSTTDRSARHREIALASIVKRPWILRARRNVRLDDFPNKKSVTRDHPGIGQLALEVGVALLDQWRADFVGWQWREPKLLELVDLSTGAVADSHNLVDEIDRGNIDHAFLGSANHLEAVIFLPDVAAE